MVCPTVFNSDSVSPASYGTGGCSVDSACPFCVVGADGARGCIRAVACFKNCTTDSDCAVVYPNGFRCVLLLDASCGLLSAERRCAGCVDS
jgi:hypothetical protein